MIEQVPVIAVALAVTTVFSALSALLLWRNLVGSASEETLRTANYAQVLVLALIALTALGQLISVTVGMAAWKGFGIYLSSVALIWLTSTWCVFSYLYTGRSARLTRPRLAGLAAGSVAMTVAVVTGGLHGQTLLDPVLVETTDGATLDFEWGVVAWLAGLYSWILSSIAVYFLFEKFLTSRNVYRKISFLHVVGGTVMLVGGFVSLTEFNPTPYLSLGPTAFSVVMVFSAPTVVTYRYVQLLPLDPILSVFGERFRSLSPMARDTIMENMNSGVLVVDHKNKLVDINPLGRRMLMAEDRRVVGQPLKEVLPPDVFETDDTGFLDPTTVDQTYRGIWTTPNADRQRCFDVQITALGSSEEPAGRVGLINDVTDREIRKEQLEQRTHELERQNEQLEEFAGVVSHDLRNPLTVAKGYVEGAKDAEENEAMLAEAEQSLDRMEDIIEDVLALAREGQSIGETERVELSAIATAAWQSVDTPSATLVVASDATLEADPDRLLNLFENCFRNAVEHGSTSDRPQADDAVEHGDESVTVTVGWEGTRFYIADDGPGIPASERDEVTSFGYTTAESGTGFGLSIVEQIAEAHGWSVAVGESDAGGAHFSFSDVDRSGIPVPDDSSR